MGHKIALIRPDLESSIPDLRTTTHEAGYDTTPSTVTHLFIEPNDGFKVTPFIDNKIKRYVGKGGIGIPLNSIYRTFVFNQILLGNMEDDSKSLNRSAFIDYAVSEWHKVSGKSSPLIFYDDSTGNEWKFSYKSTTIPVLSTYKAGSFQHSKVLIEAHPFSIDDYWNLYMDQLVVTEVWL